MTRSKFVSRTPYGYVGLFEEKNQMDFKGGVNFCNDVLFSLKNNKFKGTTIIILSSRLAPLVEDYGVINPKKV